MRKLIFITIFINLVFAFSESTQAQQWVACGDRAGCSGVIYKCQQKLGGWGCFSAPWGTSCSGTDQCQCTIKESDCFTYDCPSRYGEATCCMSTNISSKVDCGTSGGGGGGGGISPVVLTLQLMVDDNNNNKFDGCVPSTGVGDKFPYNQIRLDALGTSCRYSTTCLYQPQFLNTDITNFMPYFTLNQTQRIDWPSQCSYMSTFSLMTYTINNPPTISNMKLHLPVGWKATNITGGTTSHCTIPEISPGVKDYSRFNCNFSDVGTGGTVNVTPEFLINNTANVCTISGAKYENGGLPSSQAIKDVKLTLNGGVETVGSLSNGNWVYSFVTYPGINEVTSQEPAGAYKVFYSLDTDLNDGITPPPRQVERYSTGTFSLPDTASCNATLDWYYDIKILPGAWWRVKDADTYLNSHLSGGNLNPSVTNLFNLAGDINNSNDVLGSPGVVTAVFDSSILPEAISATQWLVEGKDYTYNTGYAGEIYDYQHFYELASKNLSVNDIKHLGEDPADLNQHIPFTKDPANDPDSDGYEWYLVNHNYTFSADTTGMGANPDLYYFRNNTKRKVILFVDGNATIDGDVNIDTYTGPTYTYMNGQTFFMLIVRGDLIIDPNSTLVEGARQIVDGIYIIDKRLKTGKDIVNHKGLTMRGSVIAWEGIDLERDLEGNLAGDNSTTPAELFRFKPDLVFLMPKLFWEKNLQWQEVAP